MRLEGVAFYILLGLIIRIESKLTPVVYTTNGPIQGEVLKTVINSIEYSSFKGIPYAEPPLGYLRFKPPVQKAPWTNVLTANVEGANCIQKDFVTEDKYTGSEDCLFLNIYTPKLSFESTNTDLLPVMVWIYGGSFKRGYGNSSLYGPDFIIEEGVVLVTFNYRLGPLGFLNLNHENATGNAALKDQNLVLRWVKHNVMKFGGNPDSVTIFGQSAGGASVDLHGISEMSQGLFHRSISMSASLFCLWTFQTPEAAVKQAFILGKKLGKTTTSTEELLKTLYEAPAIDIMNKTEEMTWANPPFKPSIESTKVAQYEEKFLTECSYWKYISGNFNKVPHLTGYAAQETVLFAKSAETIMDLVDFATSFLKILPNSSSISLPITNKVISIISQGTKNFTSDIIADLINETTDLLFVAGIDFKQKLMQARSGFPVYYYRFSYDTYRVLHRLFYGIELNGTAHGDDFAYPFHMTVTSLPLEPNDPTFITRMRMTRLWTNFAKYSNPTPFGAKDTLLQGITWPESGKSSRYLEFNKDLTIREHPTSTLADIIRTADIAILPVQTGCAGDIIKKIGDINPLAGIGALIGETVETLTKPLFNIPKLIGS